MGKLFNNNLFVQEGGGGGTGAVNSVNGKTGNVVLTKADLGLGNVDNTSDLNKPISNATQTALDAKADASDLATLTSEFETLETNVSTLETDLGDLGDVVNQNTSDIAKKLEGTNLVAGTNISISPDTEAENYTISNTYTLPAATTSALGGVKPDGTTITVTPDGTISAASSGGTTDYTDLTNKPQINSVELSGNKTLTDLGIQAAGSYATTAELDEYLTIDAAVAEYAAKDSLSTVATSGSYNDLTDKPEAYTLPTASTTTLGGVKVDGTTITATAEGVISAPVANIPVATTETAGIVKPSSLTFEVEEDGTLVNKVAGSNCYIYGLKGIGSDDITIAADTTTTIPVGRLRNYNYENGDRLKVGDMLIDLKGNVAKVDRVNTAVLPAGSGPFGVDESSVLVQLQTREDDTLTTSSKEIVGAINELKTATDSKTSKPASYAKADLPTASEHFGEFAIVTDQDNMLVWSNGTAWKEVVLSDLAA